MRGVLEQWNDQTGGAIIKSLERVPSVIPSRDRRRGDLTRAGAGSHKVARVIRTAWGEVPHLRSG